MRRGDRVTAADRRPRDGEPARPGEPVYALAWSGGKDSALALDRARRRGLRVEYLFNIYEGSSGRVRFHGTRRELIQLQARALGLTLVQEATHPRDFETVFLSVIDDLNRRGVAGVVFGNIHLADVREWYETRTRERGLEHVEPLWEEPTAGLLAEFVRRGHRAVIVSVDLSRGDPTWLGREFDDALVSELVSRTDIDPCGERGEYHSFTFAGPLYVRGIPIEKGEIVEMEGHRLLDIIAADDTAQSPGPSSITT